MPPPKRQSHERQPLPDPLPHLQERRQQRRCKPETLVRPSLGHIRRTECPRHPVQRAIVGVHGGQHASNRDIQPSCSPTASTLTLPASSLLATSTATRLFRLSIHPDRQYPTLFRYSSGTDVPQLYLLGTPIKNRAASSSATTNWFIYRMHHGAARTFSRPKQPRPIWNRHAICYRIGT